MSASRRVGLGRLVAVLVLLAGVSGCSTTAVTQSAATTFFNAVATNTVNTIFSTLFPK